MADRISIEIGVDLKRAKSEINNFKKEVSKTGVNLGSATRGVSGVRSEIDKTTKSVGLLNASLLDSVRKFTLWFGIGTAISSINRALGNLIDTVRETDATITTMAFTFEATDVQLQSMVSSTEEFAMSLGAVGSEALEAVKIFTNMSSTMDEILSKTQDVVVLNNLSKIGIENSTDALQSLQNQFNLTDEEASSLVDTLTFVSSNLKIDFSKGIQEIASGISASGKTAEQAGFSVEQYIALLGKSVEISRKSGSTVSAGFRTIFSRLRRVSDLSAEDLSKVEEAFRSVGLEVRATETTFKDMPTILTELVEKTRELDEANKETALSMIAEAAAGVRQKDTFLVMLDAWEDSLALAEESSTKIGFAMQKNEIFVNSFAGQVNLLKNEWEIFSRDVLSIDFLTGIISGFREFVGILQATEDTFGLLNATMIITLPLFVAFKGQLIATAVIGFAESVFLASLYIKELGIVAGLAEIGVAGLTVAMGALTLGLSAVVAGVVLYTRHQDKLNEEMKKTNESLQLQAENWENLNEAQRENLKIKAQETIAETANKLEDANRKLENSKKAYEDLSQSIEKWTQVQADGGKLTETETELLEMAIDAREEHSKRIKESENIIEANAVAVAIINDNLEEYIRKTKEASESTDDLSQAEEKQINRHEAIQAMQEKENERIQFLIDNYEFLSDRKRAEADNHIQNEIDKTNATIEAVQKRIEAYKQELSAIIAVASGTDALRAEKQYMKLIPFLEEQIDDLTFKRNKLVDVQDRMHGSIKKTEEALTTQEIAIRDINHELTIQQSILDTMPEDERAQQIEKINNLYRQQQQALHERANILREEQKTLSETSKEYQDIDSELQSLGQAWWNAESAIKANNDAMDEFIKKKYEDSLKKQKEELEEQNELLKEQQKAIDEIVEITEKLIEQETKEKVSALKEQISEYEEIVNLKKQSLRTTESELDFQEDLADKNKSISDLQSRILELQQDDSRSAQAERLKLEEELAEETEALNEFQRERGIELQEHALDEELENYKSEKQDEIDVLEDFLSKSGQVTAEAMKRISEDIQSESSTLYQSLIDWNELYGTSVEEDIVSAWEKARDIIDDIGVGDVSVTSRVIEETIESNEKAKESLGGILIAKHKETGVTGALNPEVYKRNPDKYEIISGDIGSFDTGGVITSDGLAMVHANEPILNPSQTANLTSMLGISGASALDNARNLFSLSNMPNISPTGQSQSIDVKFDSLVKIEGNADSSTVANLKSMASQLAPMVGQEIAKEFNKRGHSRGVPSFSR